MEIQVGDGSIYTMFIGDNQVVLAEDKDDASYMMRKLIEQYEN